MERSAAVLATVCVCGACDGGGAPLAPHQEEETNPDRYLGDPAPDASPVDASPDAAIVPDAMVAPPLPYADLDEGCAPIFRQPVVPEYHLTISSSHWAAMEYEFMNPVFNPSGSLAEPPYHPTGLHIVEGDVEHDPTGVMIKINGNTSWLQTIELDENPKMQFMIAFNKVDPDGRFQGLRKIKLDMPRTDRTFLQQRVALAWMRGRARVPAQCANSARVFINGEYYGLYANLEHQDKSFLTRNFTTAGNDGDLWKAGHELKTNEDEADETRITAFWNEVSDLDSVDEWVDLDASMDTWVAEAVVGDSDGYNQGRVNFYVYDQPTTEKFLWMATDLDTAMNEEFLVPETTPVFSITSRQRRETRWIHYLIALNDPEGIARYVQAMARKLPTLDPAEVGAWVDDWSEQIEDAAEDDPRRPFSMTTHEYAVTRLKRYAEKRADYLGEWLACWDGGGDDDDGDGYDLCHDCADSDPDISPAEDEVCDGIDNDCDGRTDDGLSCPDPT